MIRFVYLVLLYIASYNGSEGRTVQAIIGRNVSFSFTLTTKDAIKIYHDRLRFLTVWPDARYLLVSEKREKIRVSVYISAGETIIVTINLLNITTNDAGKYTVRQQWSLKEFNDSVVLQTIEESMIPKIDAARHITVDSSLVLQCLSANLFPRKILWKLNASLIETQDRYYLSNDSLSIRNLTAGDQYNVYTCMEEESELESDPYKIKSSGPGVINFTPNLTVVFELDSLNLSCNSDCSPVCAWQWTRIDPLSGLEKAVSGDNVLQINNITRQDTGKYSCKVQNILSGTSSTSYLSLDVKYSDYYMTTMTFQKDDTEPNAISYYMTTAKSQEDDTYVDAFPSMHLLMFLLLGFCVLFAIGFFTCLFRKFRKCLPVERVANTISFQDSREENPLEENPAENYWTIVSNAQGELSTAVEINTKRCTEPTAVCNRTVAEVNELEALPQLHRMEVDIELDGYIHPIH